MKFLLTYFIAFLSVSFCSAQFYAPVHSSFSTPRGNIPMTHNVWIPSNYGYTNSTNKKHKYIMYFKNDSSYTKYSQLTLNDSAHYIYYKENKRKVKVYPSQTTKLVFESQNSRYTGIPKDTCWFFKIYSGKINGFSYFPEVSEGYVVAIQNGINGEIVPLTKAAVLVMVAGHEKATALANKEKLWKAIKAYNTTSK